MVSVIALLWSSIINHRSAVGRRKEAACFIRGWFEMVFFYRPIPAALWGAKREAVMLYYGLHHYHYGSIIVLSGYGVCIGLLVYYDTVAALTIIVFPYRSLTTILFFYDNLPVAAAPMACFRLFSKSFRAAFVWGLMLRGVSDVAGFSR